jgi:penicillin amidase
VYDLADVYIEELNETGDAVIFNGQEVPLVQKEFTFEVSGGDSVTETYEWVPHHGPVISKDVAAGQAVTIKWVAQEPGNDIDFLFELMRAGSVEDARETLAPVRTINQNWVFIDTDGNIAWAPQAAIPQRPWASLELAHWLPLPGDGSAEWQGYVADEDVPSLLDPPAGFIATANNDFDGSLADGNPTNDGHTPWQSGVAPGFRHGRIVDLLEAQSGSHTAQTMLDIQADVYSLHGARLLPEVITTANENSDQLSAEAAAVLTTLENWGYECPDGLQGDQPADAAPVDDQSVVGEAAGCSAFHVLLPNLTEAAFADELASTDDYDARQSWRTLQSPLSRLFLEPDSLINGTAYFDDVTTDAAIETRADVVVAALESTATELEELFGSTAASDWLWGRIHTVTLSSLFSSAGITLFDEGPYANDGGYTTVDVANPRGRDGDYSHSAGASTRVVFEATDEGMRGNFQLPGGQDLHRDSPFYNSLMDEWLSNTPTDLLFERDEVEAAAVETYELQPAAQ